MLKILKITSLVFFAFFAWVLFMNIFSEDVRNSKRPVVNRRIETASVVPTRIINKTVSLKYELIGNLNNNTVDNLYFLISKNYDNKTQVEKLARNIERKECRKKKCNVSLYDDKRAAKLDMEYSQLLDSEKMTQWKEKNYVFVADHLVAAIMLGDFSSYPYKDWYYKKLTGQQ